MLHNVPVARILGFLFLASLVLLGLVTYQGYRISGGGTDATTHIRVALFAIVVVLFTQTMTLFYFVGTGARIKKVARRYALDPMLPERTKRFKARLFPWLTFTPLVTMVAFIIGGGAHTRVIPGWVHGGLALVALGMNLVTAILAILCIADNVVLIDVIDAALPETARETDIAGA
jgi:hypothetical protein